jgi:beta-xylosidase
MRIPLLIVLATAGLCAQSGKPYVSKVWVADRGDGTYRNPILYADYSDPDAIRVGEDYYLVASSFDAVPGLPILHSKDLVNWEILTHVYAKQPPYEVYSATQHGNGAWAPAIRYHAGEFYIFYPDPEYGIYMVKAKNAAGPWSEPLLIKDAKGWIDPCPLWDDDGNAYLVNGVAASRSAMKSILIVNRMSPDGTKLLDDGVVVFDGHAQDPTLEGPKFYKRNGYYYIFAPAGGVPTGWQLALRSRHVYGPYERKIVLARGKTAINGPHQGAWVDTPAGESWFLHFQDKDAYGRIVHLQPMKWVDDWPVMGADGEPVLEHKKPNVGHAYPQTTPVESDEFNAPSLGPQWQWQANPKPGWALPFPGLGALRIFAVPIPAAAKNFWDVPNLLLEKFPAPEFQATAKLTFHAQNDSEKTGLIVMGSDYAYVSVSRKGEGLTVSETVCKRADAGGAEQATVPESVKASDLYLRVRVAGVQGTEAANCQFSFSADGANFTPIGAPFQAKKGRWIGAKVGLFAVRPNAGGENGYADYDWFHIDPVSGR